MTDLPVPGKTPVLGNMPLFLSSHLTGGIHGTPRTTPTHPAMRRLSSEGLSAHSSRSRASSTFSVELNEGNGSGPGRAFVLGTGSAFGNHYSTDEMVEAFHKQRDAVGDSDYDRDFVARLFASLRYDAHSVALKKDDLFRRFTREEYIQHRRVALTDLAERACRMALQAWGGDPSKITHLYWGTMTGAMDSPTIDIQLAKRLGLNMDVQRTSIEGMGCLTGFRLTNIGRQVAESCKDFRVLVVAADIRSAIGNSMPDKATKADIVSAALFRDAGSACVLGCGLTPEEIPVYEILSGKSQIVPNTGHLVDYVELDGGAIRLNLAKDLPDAVQAAEEPFVSDLLRIARERCPEVSIPALPEFDIACHTGGPKILEKVGEGLGLDSQQHLRASWSVMKANGNLSGGSNLSVLHEQNLLGSKGRDWVVCISMGPGVCIEGLVMRRPGATASTAPANLKVERTALGDRGVEEMVRAAVEKKQREGHVSTDYQGKRGWRGWLLLGILGLGAGGLWAGTALYCRSATDSQHAAAMLPLALLASAAFACMLFPLDRATTLSFWSILAFHSGAAVNLVVGSAFLGSEWPDLVLPGTAVGTSLLALGMVAFAYTAFVYQAWQFMIQTSFLSVAFLLRSATAVVWAWGATSDKGLERGAHAADAVAAACFLVGLGFGGLKAFHNMQAPWLTPPNYQFFGVALYGLGEVLGNSSVVIMRIMGKDVSLDPASGVDNASRAVLYCASALFLLDTARVSYHLEKALFYCYPATTALTTFARGLWAWTAASVLFGAAAVAHLAAHALVTPPDQSSAEQDARQGLAGLGSLLMALACVVAVAVVWSGRPSEASSRGFRIEWQLAAGVLVAAGSVMQAVGFVEVKPERANNVVEVVGCGVGLLGSAIWVLLALALPAPSRWRVKPWDPLSWVHVAHPGNYVLLSACYLCLWWVLSLVAMEALGAVALLMSAVLLALNTAMAWHSWGMKHAKPCEAAQDASDSSPRQPHPLEGQHPDVEVDVMICGAGPTGLLLATILGKHGVSAMLVERRQGPVTDARWTVINSASLEHLSKVLDRDLCEELRGRAMPDSTPLGSMLVSGMAHEDAQVLRSCSTPSRRTLMEDLGNIPDAFEARSLGCKHAPELPLRANQSHQEAVLKKQVERQDSVQLRYGCMLEDMTVVNAQGADGKRSTHVLSKVAVQAADRSVLRTFVVKSKYIVGSDGPRSKVASQLGIQFDGFLNLARTRSILVRAPGLYEKVLERLGGTFMYQIARPGFGFAGVVAADPKEQLWNFLMMFGKETAEASAQRICEEFLGSPQVEPVQDRFWYWNFFLARRFRVGPGMLAGDAAHSWPPFGALGGNQGYGDAVNLGWKLAAVCKGWGSELLLESYDSERRQAAVHTALFVLNHSPRPKLINRLLPMSRWPLVRTWFASLWEYLNSGAHSVNHFSQSGIQLGNKYSLSPTICDDRWGSLPDDPFCEYIPVVHGGARVPYVELDHPDGGKVSIHSLIQPAGFTLLVVDESEGEVASEEAERSATEVLQASFARVLKEELSRALQARGSLLQAAWISRQDLRRMAAAEGGARGHAAELLAGERLVLVRPDHFVAWHWARGDAIADFWEAAAMHRGGRDAEELAQRVADTVTGLDAERRDRSAAYGGSAKRAHCASFQAWMTARFLHNLRPFVFNFPKAVPVQNNSKDEAQHTVRLSIEGDDGKGKGAAPFQNQFDITTANVNQSSAPYQNAFDITTANIDTGDKPPAAADGAFRPPELPVVSIDACLEIALDSSGAATSAASVVRKTNSIRL